MKKLVLAAALSVFMVALVAPVVNAQQPVKTEQTQKKECTKKEGDKKECTPKAKTTKKAEVKTTGSTKKVETKN